MSILDLLLLAGLIFLLIFVAAIAASRTDQASGSQSESDSEE